MTGSPSRETGQSAHNGGMATVLHPGHLGADTPCTGTAYDPDTAAYIACPHPAHNPEPTVLERLMLENEALRHAVRSWQTAAAIYHQAALTATNTTGDGE